MATITISSTTTSPSTSYPGSTCTLRIYSSLTFTASDGTPVMRGDVGSGAFFKSVSCTISSGVIAIPSFTLPSTTDALDNQNAKYTAIFYDSKNIKRDMFFAGFSLPNTLAGSPNNTWAQIRVHKEGKQPLRDISVYTKQQTDAQIDLATGTLNDASEVIKGRTKLSVAPVSASDPIATGANDPRLPTFQSSDYASLNAAVAAIGSTPGILFVTAASFASGNSCTVPATLRIDWGNVGSLSVTTGQTITIQSDVSKWPLRQIFVNALSGQGTVSFNGNYFVQEYYGELWGAVADGVTDSTAPLRAAIAANESNDGGGILRLLSGSYIVTDASVVFNITKTLQVVGSGVGTRVRFKTGTGTSVPMWRVRPTPTTSSITPRTYAGRNNISYAFRDFVIDSETISQGGDAIQFDVYTSGAYFLKSDVRRMNIYDIGGYDVNIKNDNGAGSWNDVNGSIYLTIADNVFRNGIFGKYASDSLTIQNNIIFGVTTTKPAIELTFLSGAANAVITGNSITTREGVIIHNGINLVFTRNYCEPTVLGAVGSNGAYVDFAGDVAPIEDAIIEDNIIPMLGGVALDNIRLGTMTTPFFHGNYFNTVTAGQVAWNITVGCVSPIIGINIREAGSNITNNSAASAFAMYALGAATKFAGYSGSTHFAVDDLSIYTGTNPPASVGAVRIQNALSINARNFGDTDDIQIGVVFTDDKTYIGSNAAGVVLNPSSGTVKTVRPLEFNDTTQQPSAVIAQRVTTGSIGASSSADVTLTWTVAFADTSYTAVPSVVEATASLQVVAVKSISASAVVVTVKNNDAGGAHTGTLHVIARHD